MYFYVFTMANLLNFARIMETGFKKVSAEDLDFFNSFLDEKGIFSDDESISDYSHDETEDLKFFPEIVLKPRNTEDIPIIAPPNSSE